MGHHQGGNPAGTDDRDLWRYNHETGESITSALMPSASSVSAAANVSLTIAPQLINVTSRPSLRTKATSSGMASPLSSTSPLAARLPLVNSITSPQPAKISKILIGDSRCRDRRG